MCMNKLLPILSHPVIFGVQQTVSRVPRMAGPGRFPSEFRANSEQTPSSEQIPGEFRANSRGIPSKHPKPSISLLLCATNLLGGLTTGNTSLSQPLG